MYAQSSVLNLSNLKWNYLFAFFLIIIMAMPSKDLGQKLQLTKNCFAVFKFSLLQQYLYTVYNVK